MMDDRIWLNTLVWTPQNINFCYCNGLASIIRMLSTISQLWEYEWISQIQNICSVYTKAPHDWQTRPQASCGRKESKTENKHFRSQSQVLMVFYQPSLRQSKLATHFLGISITSNFGFCLSYFAWEKILLFSIFRKKEHSTSNKFP